MRITSSNNIVGGRSVIDNPFCNGDPNAILLLTHNANPTNGMFQNLYNKLVGVNFTSSKWNIYNEDGTSIATNIAFNVLVIKN